MPRKPVTVSLPAELVRETSQYCKRRSVTMSEIVRDAVRDYLYSARLEDARRMFTGHLQKRGIFTERDLIKRVEKR